MTRFLPDTSVVVAALCAWHEHFTRAEGEVTRRLDSGDAMVLASPVLMEAYAVLTRLPAPHRLSTANAWMLLDASFVGQSAHTVALMADTYRDLIQRAAEGRIAGGRTYDAVIARCVREGEVDVLLTFNERHFRDLVPPSVAVIVPSVT